MPLLPPLPLTNMLSMAMRLLIMPQPHGRAELMGSGGGVAALMKLLREEGQGGCEWRDLLSLVVLMIGCLCTEAAGRELVRVAAAVMISRSGGSGACVHDHIPRISFCKTNRISLCKKN